MEDQRVLQVARIIYGHMLRQHDGRELTEEWWGWAVRAWSLGPKANPMLATCMAAAIDIVAQAENGHTPNVKMQ